MNDKDKITTKLEEATAEMLRSMKDKNLGRDEMFEWFGYIRGTRDSAFSAGVFTEKMQEDLEQACVLIQSLITKA